MGFDVAVVETWVNAKGCQPDGAATPVPKADCRSAVTMHYALTEACAPPCSLAQARGDGGPGSFSCACPR